MNNLSTYAVNLVSYLQIFFLLFEVVCRFQKRSATATEAKICRQISLCTVAVLTVLMVFLAGTGTGTTTAVSLGTTFTAPFLPGTPFFFFLGSGFLQLFLSRCFPAVTEMLNDN